VARVVTWLGGTVLRLAARAVVWLAVVAAAVTVGSRTGAVSWLTVRADHPALTVQLVAGGDRPLAPGRPVRWVWTVTNRGADAVSVGLRLAAAGPLADHLAGRLWAGEGCASGPAPAAAWAGPGPLRGLDAPVGPVVAAGASLPVCLEAVLPAAAGNELQGETMTLAPEPHR